MKKKYVLNTLGAAVVAALLLLNVHVVLDGPTTPHLKMSAISSAWASGSGSGSGSGSDNYSSGGVIPLLDELRRGCVLPIGGGAGGGIGGGVGVNISLTPVSGWFFADGYYYNPTAYVKGNKLICSWAWAVCWPNECVPNSESGG